MMASVPNMRPGLAPPVPGIPAPILVGGAEFASLLPAVPEELAPVLPAEAGVDAAGAKADAETIEPVQTDAPADAAELAALLPLIPVAAPAPATPPPGSTGATPTPSPAAAPVAKAQAAQVAKAPSRPLQAEVPDAPQASPQPAPRSEKIEKPLVAKSPTDPATNEDAGGKAPPADKVIETAKRVIDGVLRTSSPDKPSAPQPTPLSLPPANVRAQNGPVEREAAPAVAEAQPSPAAAPFSAIPATAPATAPAPAAAPQAGAPVDPTVERELDLARDGEWLDRLARDIARTAEGDAPMRFKLHPQTLGHMRVELSQGDHGTSVRLTVETEAARAILADAQPRLAAEARAQGVRIAESHVDLSDSGRHASGDQRRQDEARQTPIIRTVRETAEGGVAPVQPDRSRSDRYA